MSSRRACRPEHGQLADVGRERARGRLQHGLVDGVGGQQPRVVRGDGERLGYFPEAPLGVAVHGADERVGPFRGQRFDAGFLCHTSQTE